MNKKGEGYLDICVFLLVGILFCVVLLETGNCILENAKLMIKAEKVLEYATYYGNTDGTNYKELLTSLEEEDIVFSISSTSYPHVQLGEEIIVELSKKVYLGISNYSLCIPLVHRCSGLSKKYWKSEYEKR